ncbi:MAG: MoxR family ATPase [Treponemataceae bacterium]|nr:MoxR family ATPase [Treponemataceae bacterium]
MDNKNTGIEKQLEILQRIEKEVLQIFLGDLRIVRLAILGLISGLHVLIEDIPGVGKSTLAMALARATGLDFSRIQCTPDLLPADILGVNIWDQEGRKFVFKQGPIMAHFVLADELNRASPRTQAAFLEAMQEEQITLDGKTLPLPQPFFVIATQNPQNFVGTFPLPEAELDRFGLFFSIGYPAEKDEVLLLEHWQGPKGIETISPITTIEEINRIRQEVQKVLVTPVIQQYIVSLCRATRNHPDIRLGASPRAALFLQQAARGRAYMEGRSFVIPEDVEAIAIPVLVHRLTVSSQVRLSGKGPEQVVRTIVQSIPKPTGL